MTSQNSQKPSPSPMPKETGKEYLSPDMLRKKSREALARMDEMDRELDAKRPKPGTNPAK